MSIELVSTDSVRIKLLKNVYMNVDEVEDDPFNIGTEHEALYVAKWTFPYRIRVGNHDYLLSEDEVEVFA